jgi:hypothetical protein
MKGDALDAVEVIDIVPLSDPHHVRADTKMIEMAIKKKWNIPDNILNSLPTILGGIVATSEDDRTRIGASRVLVSMHGQNIQAEDGPAKVGPTINVGVSVNGSSQDKRDRFLAIAERVRISRDSADNSI